MNIDRIEIQRIANTTGVNRRHLYTTIHKALRARMSALLVRVGQMDAHDEKECREVVKDLEQLLNVMQDHLKTEDSVLHPYIEARNPGALADIAADHAAQKAVIDQLRQHVQAVLPLSGDDRVAFSLFLYRELALFIADNLTHMHAEETANHQLLWSTYSEAELHEIHAAILASIPPEKMTFTLQWMLPAMSPAERFQMFLEIRTTAPAPAFEAVLEIARSSLSGRDWGKLTSSLGVAQVPGLVSFTSN